MNLLFAKIKLLLTLVSWLLLFIYVTSLSGNSEWLRLLFSRALCPSDVHRRACCLSLALLTFVFITCFAAIELLSRFLLFVLAINSGACHKLGVFIDSTMSDNEMDSSLYLSDSDDSANAPGLAAVEAVVPVASVSRSSPVDDEDDEVFNLFCGDNYEEIDALMAELNAVTVPARRSTALASAASLSNEAENSSAFDHEGESDNGEISEYPDDSRDSDPADGSNDGEDVEAASESDEPADAEESVDESTSTSELDGSYVSIPDGESEMGDFSEFINSDTEMPDDEEEEEEVAVDESATESGEESANESGDSAEDDDDQDPDDFDGEMEEGEEGEEEESDNQMSDVFDSDDEDYEGQDAYLAWLDTWVKNATPEECDARRRRLAADTERFRLTHAQCGLCPMIFRKAAQLRLHLRTKHNANAWLMPCDIARFIRLYQEVDEEISCPICPDGDHASVRGKYLIYHIFGTFHRGIRSQLKRILDMNVVPEEE
jgi:hypothetical protein